jgi:Zn-dependent protease with chaperone function
VDFFARQERSRRTSRALVVTFLLAFVAVALATTAAVALGLRTYTESNELFLGTGSMAEWLESHWGLVATVASGTLGLMILASLFRTATLAGGGGNVAKMLGGTQITRGGNDPLQRRLVNVVEEMALASGLPVPEIYVLERESGINAFAAGLAPANAAVAVTRGALERLDRAELQGVIAHEFSHIANGDMRLNQQLIGLSFGILVLSLAGRWLMRSSRFAPGNRRNRNGAASAALLLGLALTVIGGIGVLLSRLIKAGVSRERERLADASAVQFTREPAGLAGALKKIGGHTARIVGADTEEVAHMLFEPGRSALASWFATHPPLLERIRALEPSFDPRDLPAAGASLPEPRHREDAPSSAGAAASFAAEAATGARLLERTGAIGAPAAGRALRDALPDEIYHAAHSRDSSLLVVVALALSVDDATRRQQLALIERQLGATRATLAARLHAEIAPLEPRLRLPVLELALPTIRQRPPEQISYLAELLLRIQELDRAPRLFDFVLLRVLEHYLRAAPEAAARLTRPIVRLEGRAAVRALLCNVAAFGHDEPAHARAAYAAGLAVLGWRAESGDPSFDPPARARNLPQLDAALAALGNARPRDKERVLRGVLATIQADRITATEERELFRLIATTLDCPLPADAAL